MSWSKGLIALDFKLGFKLKGITGGPSHMYYQASATDPECSSQSGL